jgi:hypothetical protein
MHSTKDSPREIVLVDHKYKILVHVERPLTIKVRLFIKKFKGKMQLRTLEKVQLT